MNTQNGLGGNATVNGVTKLGDKDGVGAILTSEEASLLKLTPADMLGLTPAPTSKKPAMDIRAVRFVMDTALVWHVHQTQDANAELIFDTDGHKLVNAKTRPYTKYEKAIPTDFATIVRTARVTMDSAGGWTATQTPDANLEITFSADTMKLIRCRAI